MATSPLLSILDSIYLAKDLDLLHLSISNLLDMIKDGEIDVVLDQNSKSIAQKLLFLEKIIKSIEHPGLQKQLYKEIEAKNITFFHERTLSNELLAIQKAAESINVVHLQVAIDFKGKDLQDMVRLLEQRIEGKVVLNLTIDRNLIGGAVVQFGNYISDYSVQTRLNQFRTEWKAAVAEGK